MPPSFSLPSALHACEEDKELGASAASRHRATDAPHGAAKASPPSGSVSTDAVERLALNLRAYAYAMGAPRRDTDEEEALDAARLMLPVLLAEAGARELYAALVALVAAADGYASEQGHRLDGSPDIANARAALAKARGEAS